MAKQTDDVSGETLEQTHARLHEKYGDVFPVKLRRSGRIVWVREIPTARSHDELVDARSELDGKEPGPEYNKTMMDLGKAFVLQNVVEPPIKEARDLLDDQPWLYNKLTEKLIEGMQLELVDLKKS